MKRIRQVIIADRPCIRHSRLDLFSVLSAADKTFQYKVHHPDILIFRCHGRIQSIGINAPGHDDFLAGTVRCPCRCFPRRFIFSAAAAPDQRARAHGQRKQHRKQSFFHIFLLRHIPSPVGQKLLEGPVSGSQDGHPLFRAGERRYQKSGNNTPEMIFQLLFPLLFSIQ